VRTTITLDDDVAAKLKAEMRRTGRTFKQVVNEVLRGALTARAQRQPPKPFVVHPRPLGLRPGVNYDRISDLIEQIEGPLHR
jgi:hypothetical protein